MKKKQKYFIWDHKNDGFLMKGGVHTTRDVKKAHAYSERYAIKKASMVYEIVEIQYDKIINQLLADSSQIKYEIVPNNKHLILKTVVVLVVLIVIAAIIIL